MVDPRRRPARILFVLISSLLAILAFIAFKVRPDYPQPGINTSVDSSGLSTDEGARDKGRERRVILSVRSAVSGDPVLGATFRSGGATYTSNDKGELSLPLDAKEVACVDASWMGRKVIVENDATSWLVPAGSLRIRCKDPQGAVLAGVPYSATIEGLDTVMASVTRYDPALGAVLARFMGRGRYRSGDRVELPVAGPLRVVFAGGHRISGRLVPVPVSRDERGGVQHRPGPVLHRYSDLHVTLEQGATVERECVLDRPCVITGQAASVQDPAVTVSCTLFHRVGKSDVIEHWDQERKIQIGSGEPFRMEGVLPGRKKLLLLAVFVTCSVLLALTRSGFVRNLREPWVLGPGALCGFTGVFGYVMGEHDFWVTVQRVFDTRGKSMKEEMLHGQPHVSWVLLIGSVVLTSACVVHASRRPAQRDAVGAVEDDDE